MSGLSTFVGRRDELAALARVLDLPHRGRGALVLVLGEPGIGKTSLVATALTRTDLPASWARAREEPGAPPLWLWDQVSHPPLVAGTSTDTARRGAASVTVDVSGPRDPPSAASALVGTGHDRFVRFDQLSRRLLEPARREPFVAVLDDLQWADAESRAFLDFLEPDLADTPLVIIVTSRPLPPAALPRADLTLFLRGLPPESLAQLLAAETGDAVHPELVAAVADGTGGNPFLATEVARQLRGAADAADQARGPAVLSHGARALLARRLADLPPATRALLAVLAVLGTPADADVVAAVLDVPVADVHDRAAAAVSAGLADDTGQALCLSHTLVREAVLAEDGPAARIRLHGRVAAVLEATAGPQGAAAISAHARAAGDRVSAARWAATAGDAAFAAAMYAEAAVWFRRAVEDTPAPPTGLRVRLADALSRSGQVQEANTTYLAAAAEARASGDGQTAARAVLGAGTVGGAFEVRMLDADQLEMVRQALDALGPEDSAIRSMLMARLSVSATLTSDHTRRARLAADAVAMARRLGDDAALAYALSAFCDAHAGPVDLQARVAAATEMLTAARWAKDPELELLARRHLFVAQMESGDLPSASRTLAAFVELADALRQPQFCWYARLGEAMLAMLRGALDEAEALGRQAAELGRRAGSGNARMLADGALLPMIERERGGHGYAAMIAEMNRDHPEAARGLQALPLFGVGHGVGVEEVRGSLADWRDFAPGPDDGLYLMAMALVGSGGAYVRDEDAMSAARAALEPYSDRLVLDGTAAVCYGPAALTLAQIAVAQGDLAEAERRYDETERILMRIGALGLLARVRKERGSPEASPAGARVRSAAQPQHPDVAPLTSAGGPDDEAALVREGDVWVVAFAGRTVRLRHGKGLGDLARLLAEPGREFHVLDLTAVGEGRAPVRAAAVNADLGAGLDETARTAYRHRIRDLMQEIDEASALHDDERTARLDDERALLLSELSRAYGLSGRPRPQGSDSERARKAVGMRVHQTIERIDAALPELGRHLRNSVRTGTYCSYMPEHPRTWHCQP